MTKEKQKELFEKFTKRELEIMQSKSADYAKEEDVLSNFKTAGANVGITTQQQILSLIATKVARLGNLFKGKVPNNESIEDSIIDLSNYSFLLYCSIKEDDLHSNKGVKNQDSPQPRFKNNCY
jgi:hypothetical protein